MRKKSKLPKAIVLVAPTASGKSDLAIKIAFRLRSGRAKKFGIKGAEIISADSRQIYRGMDIGTAKPTQEEMTTVPHHLINIKNPDQNYTVAEYKRDAIKTINKILKKKKLPILIGGTGLYIKAIIDNLNIPEVAPDLKLRKKFEKEIEKYGLKHVFEKLIQLDPEAAYIVDPNNPRRIIRALEIAIKTKKPFSSQRKIGKPIFDFIEIGLSRPKKDLYKRINKRVDSMIKAGLTGEVEGLVKKHGAKQQSFDAIGYREIINYLNKKITLNKAIDLVKKNTRSYAKRQVTWFRKDKKIHWIRNEKQAEKLIKKFLKK